MVDDIPATPRQIALFLGISPATFSRYLATNSAPRPVLLALFWETKWGRSAADSEAHNFGVVHYNHAKTLERANAQLLRHIATLEDELARSDGSSAANSPVFQLG